MQKLRENFKKLLVSLLTISICLGYVPMTAYADEIEEVAIEETETIVDPISEESNAPAEETPAESITEEPNAPAEEEPAESITEESNAPAEEAPAELSSEEESAVEETPANLTEEILVNETAQEASEEITVELNSILASVESANPPEGQTEQEYIDEMKQKYGEDIMDKIDEAVQNPTEENIVSVINQVTGNEAAVASENLSDSEGNTITGTIYKSGDKYYQVTVDQETEKITINELVNVVEDNKVLEDLYSPDSLVDLYAQYGEENVKTEEKFTEVPCLNDFSTPEKVQYIDVDSGLVSCEQPDVLQNGEVFYPFKYIIFDDVMVDPGVNYEEIAWRSTTKGDLIYDPIAKAWKNTSDSFSNYANLVVLPYSYDELMAFAQEGDEEKIALLKNHGYSFELGKKPEFVGYEVTILGKSYYQLGNGNELLNVKIPVKPNPDPIDPIGPIAIDIREHAENAISTSNNSMFANTNLFNESTCICYTSLGPINVKMADVDTRTDNNQRFLASCYLAYHPNVVMTKNLYLGINISGTERCSIVFNGFKPYEDMKVAAVVYNQLDGAYTIYGTVINGQAVFENFILRPASTITICY